MSQTVTTQFQRFSAVTRAVPAVIRAVRLDRAGDQEGPSRVPKIQTGTTNFQRFPAVIRAVRLGRAAKCEGTASGLEVGDWGATVGSRSFGQRGREATSARPPSTRARRAAQMHQTGTTQFQRFSAVTRAARLGRAAKCERG